jgi:ABC-type nitrate/sulfonate/bicarbonate transport system substrate-binding protein
MFAAERIEAGHYGMASNLNRFLLQSNRESYVRFIEALKEGQKWEEALHNAYGSTPDELLAAYARWINLPNLQP